MKKVSAPGRIYSRKLPKGNYLYYTIYNDSKRYSSGLKDTSQNREIITRIQEKAYVDFLTKSEKINSYQISKSEYFIFDLWNEYVEKELSQKQPKTIISYSRAYKLLITNNHEINEKVRFHNVQISSIELMIKDNIAHLKKKLSNATINIQIRSIQVFLNWCKSNYYLRESIKIGKYLEKVEQKTIVSYGDEVINLILKDLIKADKEFALFMLLMGNTGLRMTETLELTWNQIDFKKRRINLRNKIKKHEYDSIPITNKVNEILEELKTITLNRKIKQDKVFRWESNSYSRLIKKFNSLLSENGLKVNGTAFHGFRKMFLNKIAQLPNMNILDFQRVARIRDIKTAHNHYLQKENERLINLLESI